MNHKSLPVKVNVNRSCKSRGCGTKDGTPVFPLGFCNGKDPVLAYGIQKEDAIRKIKMPKKKSARLFRVQLGKE